MVQVHTTYKLKLIKEVHRKTKRSSSPNLEAPAGIKLLGYTIFFKDLHPGKKHQTIGYGVVTNEDIFSIKEQNS